MSKVIPKTNNPRVQLKRRRKAVGYATVYTVRSHSKNPRLSSVSEVPSDKTRSLHSIEKTTELGRWSRLFLREEGISRDGRMLVFDSVHHARALDAYNQNSPLWGSAVASLKDKIEGVMSRDISDPIRFVVRHLVSEVSDFSVAAVADHLISEHRSIFQYSLIESLLSYKPKNSKRNKTDEEVLRFTQGLALSLLERSTFHLNQAEAYALGKRLPQICEDGYDLVIQLQHLVVRQEAKLFDKHDTREQFIKGLLASQVDFDVIAALRDFADSVEQITSVSAHQFIQAIYIALLRENPSLEITDHRRHVLLTQLEEPLVKAQDRAKGYYQDAREEEMTTEFSSFLDDATDLEALGNGIDVAQALLIAGSIRSLSGYSPEVIAEFIANQALKLINIVVLEKLVHVQDPEQKQWAKRFVFALLGSNKTSFMVTSESAPRLAKLLAFICEGDAELYHAIEFIFVTEKGALFQNDDAKESFIFELLGGDRPREGYVFDHPKLFRFFIEKNLTDEADHDSRAAALLITKVLDDNDLINRGSDEFYDKLIGALMHGDQAAVYRVIELASRPREPFMSKHIELAGIIKRDFQYELEIIVDDDHPWRRG